MCVYSSKELPELSCEHFRRAVESEMLRWGVSLMLFNLVSDVVAAGKAGTRKTVENPPKVF